MPDKTANVQAMRLIRNAERQHLEDVLAEIALSALDGDNYSSDVGAVVYEQLAKLGIIAP